MSLRSNICCHGKVLQALSPKWHPSDVITAVRSNEGDIFIVAQAKGYVQVVEDLGSKHVHPDVVVCIRGPG